MSIDFSAMTVIELRKMAKEMGVKLGAGVNKADIVDKLTLAEKARESVTGTASSGDLTAMTAADVDWIVLGIPPLEPEPETEPEEQEGGE